MEWNSRNGTSDVDLFIFLCVVFTKLNLELQIHFCPLTSVAMVLLSLVEKSPFRHKNHLGAKV